MLFVDVSRHPVTHVQVINLSSSEGRNVHCCCVSASCFPCTCYKSIFLGRKSCSFLVCLGIMLPMYMQYIFLPRKEAIFFDAVSRHHVSHVHVIDLFSVVGRHVLCCCVSASCFPCTCCRSFFLGRKKCYLLMCLGILLLMYKL